jgi:glycosyltransferase involved in cell wall biosynthesis
MVNETGSSVDGSSGAEPLVSVIIPVLNGERHIAACLESVIHQSYENIEIVVANNSSTDHTVEIVRGFEDPRLRIPPSRDWSKRVGSQGYFNRGRRYRPMTGACL